MKTNQPTVKIENDERDNKSVVKKEDLMQFRRELLSTLTKTNKILGIESCEKCGFTKKQK